MDIYDDAGELDIDKARRALDETGAIHSADTRRSRVAEIQIATLLDIAGSLRVVALEAGAAMGYDATRDIALIGYDDIDDATRDFLVVGDLVHVVGDTAPGEVMSLGFDEGDPYAIVDFAEAKGVRYYVRNLERLVGDVAEEHVAAMRAEEAALAALPTVGDDLEDGTDPDLYDEPDEVTTQRPDDGLGLVGTIGHEDIVAALSADDQAAYERGDEVHTYATDDDIDADFEGDNHPAADDALAVLKANEEKRKAAKKGKKK